MRRRPYLSLFRLTHVAALLAHYHCVSSLQRYKVTEHTLLYMQHTFSISRNRFSRQLDKCSFHTASSPNSRNGGLILIKVSYCRLLQEFVANTWQSEGEHAAVVALFVCMCVHIATLFYAQLVSFK